MANIIKEVRLIKVEQTAEDNNNKWWNAQLFDDGTVKAQWGRVGYDGQSGEWSGGESYLDKKVREKTKKGYVEQKTVGTANVTPGSTVKVDANLREIAKKQIIKNNVGSPLLVALIDRLVQSNVHKITSSTQITFNNTTGLFTTPLGVVTPEGITEARDLLAKIHPSVKSGRFSETLNAEVLRYLRIIPQNLGMGRFNAKTIFPDDAAIQKQSDILDSLESSYQAMTTTPQAPGTPTSEPKVFQVDLDVLPTGAEFSRLTNWFEKSKKPMHRSVYGMKVKQIYTVNVHDMTNAYENNSAPHQEVWHGTSQANLLSILKSGLRVSPPSTAAIASKMFGNGIYGADVSTKSLNYSVGYWGQGGRGDSAWLFVCKFAMGKIQTVTKEQKRGADRGYDSIYAKGGYDLFNDEFIVFRNSQVKITHLLECK